MNKQNEFSESAAHNTPHTTYTQQCIVDMTRPPTKRYTVSHSAHKKFKALAPDLVSENRNARLEMSVMLNYPELRANPFGDRICKVRRAGCIRSLSNCVVCLDP